VKRLKNVKNDIWKQGEEILKLIEIWKFSMLSTLKLHRYVVCDYSKRKKKLDYTTKKQ